LQRAVLEAVRESNREVCFNELCWRIAERTSRVAAAPSLGPLKAGAVANGFYQAFTRAVFVLARKEIHVTKRKFGGLVEFCRLYPYRSLKLEVRGLREVILRSVLRYLQETDESQFTAAETEAHFIERLPDDVLHDADLRWREIRMPMLAAAVREGETTCGNLLFELAIKGDELFKRAGLRHPHSLSSLLRSCEKMRPALDPLVRLRSLLDNVFPRPLRGHANLKRRLYAVADFSQSMNRPRLKIDFERWMLTDEEARSFLEQLPGHQNASPRTRPDLHTFHSLTPERNPVLSPLLAQLLGRDALAPAKFLSC
jgi:hypothetical protein